jgi:hypothetical protein
MMIKLVVVMVVMIHYDDDDNNDGDDDDDGDDDSMQINCILTLDAVNNTITVPLYMLGNRFRK